jgi:hypothetical protein
MLKEIAKLKEEFGSLSSERNEFQFQSISTGD